MADSTILFPNFNNEHVLPLTFEYLRKNVDCSSVNLVVVDDGSEDKSVPILKAEISKSGFANAELIELSHQGIIVALNAGLNACRTEFVFRIDGDATVETPGWLEHLKKYLADYPEIGLVGGQIKFDNGRVHSLGRSVIGEQGLFDMGTYVWEQTGARTFCSHTHRPRMTFQNGHPYAVDTLLGVCAAFRLSDAREVGNFDLNYSPVWIEDDDFGLMLRKLGKHVITDPNIWITHRTSLRGSRTPGEVARQNRVDQKPPREKLSLSKFVPYRVKEAAKAILGITRDISQPSPVESFVTETNPWRINILKKHYKYWQSKWGFDLLNPDLSIFYDRYWDTLICWKLNPDIYRSTQDLLRNLGSPNFVQEATSV